MCRVNKYWAQTAILVSALLLSSLFAGVASAADIKVGFVNIALVMEKAPQAEAASKALEEEFSERDTNLTATRDLILGLEDRLKRDGDLMTPTKRSELEREILKGKRDYSRAKDELKEDFNIRRNEELNKLQRKINDVILELARSEGYDLLVTERVLYASERIDVTKLVLEQLSVIHNKP